MKARTIRWTALALATLLLGGVLAWAIPLIQFGEDMSYPDVYHRSNWRNEGEILSATFEVSKSHRYLVLGVATGYSKPNSGVEATFMTPQGVVLGPFAVEPGECHLPDSCSWARSTGPGGSEHLVLEYAPSGTYTVRVRLLSGEDWPPHGFGENVGVSAGGFDRRVFWESLLSNNIYWYQPDGSRRFVQDGGYGRVGDAWAAAVAASILWVASAAWVGFAHLGKRRAATGGQKKGGPR